MKNAPNLKKQPADLMEESIIFAGADAWTFAKAWQEMNPIGDTVPPVVLDKKQLAELENIRIVDDGRLYARVCRGGHLTERQITILATKLAVAGVERAQFYSEGYQLLEDWTPQLPRLKADAEAGKSMVIGKPLTDVNLRDLADNEKALILAARYTGIAINENSEGVYVYRAGIWEKTSLLELSREMVAIYNPDTLKDFTRGVAAVSEQAANILDYLKNKLPPVNPLASDDVQGFMRDSEMRQAFARLDRRSQEKMLLSMHSGKHQELADALLRAHAVCSGLDTEQLNRLGFSRIASENGQVISAVADLVDAVRKDVAQITAVRTWYNNLVYGKNDDPSDVQPRMTGLDQLSEHVSAMLKGSQQQTRSEDKQAA